MYNKGGGKMAEMLNSQDSDSTKIAIYKLKLEEIKKRLEVLKQQKSCYEYETYRKVYINICNKIRRLKEKLKSFE